MITMQRVLAGLLASTLAGCDSTRFDAALWESADRYSAQGRCGMVEDLSKTRLGRGMSRSEVRRLLGEPDESDFAGSRWANRGRYDAYVTCFYYNVIDYDTDYLVLFFDAADRLVAWETATIQG